MYIPSNYSLEEVLKVVDVPQELLPYLDQLYDELNTIELKLKQEERAYELLNERESNARTLIETLLQTVRTGANLRQVKKQIELDVEDSYYEF